VVVNGFHAIPAFATTFSFYRASRHGRDLGWLAEPRWKGDVPERCKPATHLARPL